MSDLRAHDLRSRINRKFKLQTRRPKSRAVRWLAEALGLKDLGCIDHSLVPGQNKYAEESTPIASRYEIYANLFKPQQACFHNYTSQLTRTRLATPDGYTGRELRL